MSARNQIELRMPSASRTARTVGHGKMSSTKAISSGFTKKKTQNIGLSCAP